MLSKIKRVFLSRLKLLYVLLSCSSILFCFFSYAVGYNNYNSRLDSFLFELDYVAKSQPSYSYLDNLPPDKKSKQESYKYLRMFTVVEDSEEKKDETYNLFRQYSNHCHNSVSNRMYTGFYGIGDLSGFHSFDVDAGDDCSWKKASIFGVASDNNASFISYLGLPLFLNSQNSRNTSIPKHEAKYGAIISFSAAYSIIQSEGILESNDGDVRKSIEQLVNTEPFTFKINVDQKSISCSISDVYIDSNGIEYLSSEQLTRVTNVYRNYEIHFGQWNSDGIFIYNPDLFKSNSLVFAFDIYRNYGNFKSVFNNVLGSNYQQKGINISLYKKVSEDPVAFSKIDTSVLQFNSPTALVVFLYPFLVISFILVCFFYIFATREIIASVKEFIISSICVAAPFFLCQIFLYIFIATKSLRLTGILLFNNIGNIILLFVTFLLIGCGIYFFIRRRKKYVE